MVFFCCFHLSSELAERYGIIDGAGGAECALVQRQSFDGERNVVNLN